MITTNEVPIILDINPSSELSPKFLTPASVGECNPEWALLKQEDNQQKIYMIRKTKSTAIHELLRPTEVAKIKRGKKHLTAIGIDDYVKSLPEDWSI